MLAKRCLPWKGELTCNAQAPSNDPDKVWPTGLTLREAEEVHSSLIDGTRVFGVIALIAHSLVAVSTPWLG